MNESQSNSFLAEQPVGALMRKFSLPCILSLLVGALYNIVDQLFIANASYLGSYGNAANSVVDVLRFALARPNIALRAGEAVTAVRRQGRGFVIETESETIPTDRVIIACGGAPLEWIEEQVSLVRSMTDKPIGANVMLMDPNAAEVAKLLADRLTEAFAEALHRYARVTLWGYEREGQWSVGDLLAEKYQGIRPAFGYPSAPDHSLKADVFALMDVGTVTGMTMTESYMIVPGEAACGLMLGHPEARNFSVGRIDSEQLASYAARRGTDPEKMRVLIPQHLIDM